MDDLQFEWDATKASQNAGKHGVTFSEASSAFRDPLARLKAEQLVDGESREAMVGCRASVDCSWWSWSIEDRSASSARGEQRRSSAMHTKKPVADQDIAPEYDFTDAGPNPYAGRYRDDHVPVITGSESVERAESSARTGPKKELGRHDRMLADGLVIDVAPSARVLRPSRQERPGPAARRKPAGPSRCCSSTTKRWTPPT